MMKRIILILMTLTTLVSCSQFEKMEFEKVKTEQPATPKYKRVETLYDGYIIQRRIEGTPFFHFGVVEGDKIIHYDQLGVHESTLEEFAKGLEVLVTSDKKKDIVRDSLFQSKVEQYRNSKYEMMTNNCEHFAYDLVFNQKVSLQTDNAFQYLQETAPVWESYLKKKNPEDSLEIDLVFKMINDGVLDGQTARK